MLGLPLAGLGATPTTSFWTRQNQANTMSKLQSGRRHLRNVISTIPALYCPIARLGKGGFRVVTKETDLVIEGFPRSGNSYVEAAFVCSQNSNLKFAHHTHAAANVLRAVQLNIPSYVLIRAPMDCCISLAIQSAHTHDLSLSISEYIRYYRAIRKVADKLCLVPFEVATKDFNASVAHLNTVYKTQFDMLPAGLSREDVMQRVDTISRERGTVPLGTEPYSPFASDAVKAQRKERQDALRAQLSEPKLARHLAIAQEVYAEVVAMSPLWKTL